MLRKAGHIAHEPTDFAAFSKENVASRAFPPGYAPMLVPSQSVPWHDEVLYENFVPQQIDHDPYRLVRLPASGSATVAS